MATVICTPYREPLEFTDSQGLCWICEPSGPCRLCDSSPSSITNVGRFDFNCPMPRCTRDQANLLFPVASDPRRYWECNSGGRASQRDCDCGTYFNWASQSCEFPWNTQDMCDDTMFNPPIPPPRPCQTPERPVRPIFPESPIRPWPENPLPGIDPVPPFDRRCSRPACTQAGGLLYPVANDPTTFYQCAGVDGRTTTAVIMECQCGTFFNWGSQRCETPDHVSQFCDAVPSNPQPRPCTNDPNDPIWPTQTVTWPTLSDTWPTQSVTWPTQSPPNCMPCIPLWPCLCSCNNQSNCGCSGGNTCRT